MKILIILLLICSTAQASDWTPKDKTLLAGYAVLNAIDTYQTAQINGRDGIKEMNPMFTDSEGNVDMSRVIGFKLLSVAGVYLLADYIPEYRTGILSVAVGLQGAVVAWNLQF